MAANNLFDDNGLGFGAPRTGRTTAAAGAGLSAVFQKDASIKSAGNQSLSYTSVKPKKSTQAVAAAAPATAASGAVATGNVVPIAANTPPVVLHACPVSLISYDANRKSVVLGQRGCALLRAGNTFSLVCYEFTSQRQECTATIAETFNFNVASDRYATFYDDKKSYWCIQPTTDEHLFMLARHIALVKNAAAQLSALANGSSVGLISQDLTSAPSSDSPAIATGDRVGVKYSMYLTSASHPKGLGVTVGTVGGDKPRNITVGERKELAGLEQGLIGLKKNQRRFLVIPPSLAYGNKDSATIPANSTILIEVQAAKHKIAEKVTTAASTTGGRERSSSSASSVGAPPLQLPGAPSPLFPTSDDFDDTTPATTNASASTSGGLFASQSSSSIGNDDTPPLRPQPSPTVPAPLAAAPAAVANPSGATSEEDATRARLRARVTGMGVRMPFTEPAAHSHDDEDTHASHGGHGHGTSHAHAEALFGTGPSASPALTPGSSGSSASHPADHGAHFGGYQSHLQPGAPNAHNQHGQQQHGPHGSQQQQHHGYGHGPHSVHPQSTTPSHLAGHHGSHPQQQQQQAQLPQGYGYGNYGPGGPNPYGAPPVGQQSHAHADIFAGISSPSPSPSSSIHVGGRVTPSPITSIAPPQVVGAAAANSNVVVSGDVHTKLDGIYTEVKQLSDLHKGLSSNLGYEQRVTGTQVIQALTALVKERDRLQAASDAATLRVSDMQAKISELHERNEKYMSEHTATMQKRYDTFQEDAKRHNQQIMDLREEKRHLAEELNAAKLTVTETAHRLTLAHAEIKRDQANEAHARELESKVAGLTAQLELVRSSQTHREAEVKSELAAQISQLTGDHELAKARVATLTDQIEERNREVITLQADLRSARQAARQASDELAALRNSHDSVIEEQRSRYAALEASSSDAKTAFTRELTEANQSIADHKQQMDDLATQVSKANSQNESLRLQVTALDAQIVSLRSAEAVARNEEYERGRKETTDLARKQIDDVVAKARARVAEYETRITALTEEKDNIVTQSRTVIANLKNTAAARIQAAEQKAADSAAALVEAETKAAGAIAASSSGSVSAAAAAVTGPTIDDIKKLMSRVYFAAASSFADDTSYASDDIKVAVRNAIKTVTLEMVATYSQASSASPAAPPAAAPTPSTEASAAVPEPSSDNAPSDSAPSVEPESAITDAKADEIPSTSAVDTAPVGDDATTATAAAAVPDVESAPVEEVKVADTTSTTIDTSAPTDNGEHNGDSPVIVTPSNSNTNNNTSDGTSSSLPEPSITDADIEVVASAVVADVIASVTEAAVASAAADVVAVPSSLSDDTTEPGSSTGAVVTTEETAPVAAAAPVFPSFDDYSSVAAPSTVTSDEGSGLAAASAPPTATDVDITSPSTINESVDVAETVAAAAPEAAAAAPVVDALSSPFGDDDTFGSSSPMITGGDASVVLPTSFDSTPVSAPAVDDAPANGVDIATVPVEEVPVVVESPAVTAPPAVVETTVPVVVAASPVAPAAPAKVATPTRAPVSSLFGGAIDDTDTDGTDSLFAIASQPAEKKVSPNTPAKSATAAPAKKSSLFGDDDDDDDDGALFAKPTKKATPAAAPTSSPWDD